MKDKIKIAVTGGSGVYTPGLMLSIVKNIDKLPEMDIVLCGRTKDKLEKIFTVSDLIASESKGRLRVYRNTSMEDAIEGSDVVINQVRVGGFEARSRDESFAGELGIVEEETIGVVGLSNALRTIPVVLRYAELTEKLAPDAWFLNFTNPASMTIRAIKRKTGLKVFGVCDLPEVLAHAISDALGESRENLYFKYAGINHMGWITDVIKSGKSIINAVFGIAEKLGHLGVDPDIIRFSGAVPVPFLKYYYHPDIQIEKARKKGITRGDELNQLESELLKVYSDKSIQGRIGAIKSLLFQKRNPVWYEYCVAPVLVSLFGEVHSTHIVMIENNGAVEELADDDIAEVTAYIDGNGIKPVKDTKIPLIAKGLLKSIACFESLAVDAVSEPDENNILRALMSHPAVPSYRIAKESLSYLMKQVKA
jgi:6-phospho-beta-glucosidase